MRRVDVVIAVTAQYTTCHGPRPGLTRANTWAASWAGRSGPYEAHISWASAQPGPSNVRNSRPGLTLLITFAKCSARPSPAHHIGKIVGPAHDNFQIDPARPCSYHRPMISWQSIFMSLIAHVPGNQFYCLSGTWYPVRVNLSTKRSS